MDTPSTPSSVLRSLLASKGITAYQLSQQTILAQSKISEILSGKRRITAETATILGDFFENGADFWVALQSSFDLRKSLSDDSERYEDRGDLQIGGWRVRCYVTPSERRMISDVHFIQLMGFKGISSRQRCVDLIDSPYLRSQKMEALRKKLGQPFRLVGPDHEIVHAYEGSVVIDYCNALLDVRRIGGLPEWAKDYANQAEIIITSVAKVGMDALIDEATGHQSKRHREALQALLARYFREEYAAWTKRFPDWFYEELFRLKGWQWNALSSKRPGVVGKITRDVVYQRIDPEVLKELERRNPIIEPGRRKVKHHQWLTDDVGHPALDAHFYALRGLMRINHDWRKFYHQLQMAFPLRNEHVQMELDDYRSSDDDLI